MTKAIMWVVAGALRRSEDAWLMHRRPLEKHHGGLWEFPGGKIEDTEIPVKALIRELHEELGIEVFEESCKPVGFAESGPENAGQPIVILLYVISDWRGEPLALEGGEVGWFSPNQIAGLAKPPLDDALAHALFEKQP